jgi:hypothetical protein
MNHRGTGITEVGRGERRNVHHEDTKSTKKERREMRWHGPVFVPFVSSW